MKNLIKIFTLILAITNLNYLFAQNIPSNINSGQTVTINNFYVLNNDVVIHSGGSLIIRTNGEYLLTAL